MKYKQYLHSVLDECHRICATTDVHITAPGNHWLENLNVMYCREASVRFITDGSSPTDPDDLLTFSAPPPVGGENGDDYEQDYFYALYYVAALETLPKNRKLLGVEYCDGRIDFHVGIFDLDGDGDEHRPGDQYFYVSVALDHLPKGVKIVVTMEPMKALFDDELGAKLGLPDTYEIRNLAGKGEPMRLSIDELRNGELGEDEKGKFEIITEP